MVRHSAWKIPGSLYFTLGGLLYLLAETFTAAAWHHPAYSYRRNYISDLGIASCGMTPDGRDICSPLHSVMNIGFAAEGILFIVACGLLRPVFNEPGRRLFLFFGVLHGLGGLLIALFHSGTGTDGITLHQTGAVMAIGGGNACLLMAGWMKRNRWRCFSRLSFALESIGLLSMFTISFNVIPVGIIERMSVYTITSWQILAGIGIARKSF